MLRRSLFFGSAAALTALVACAPSPTSPPQARGPLAASRAAAPATCTLANGKVVATGFDQYGYNRCAHNFVGTYGGWCEQQGLDAGCAGVPGDTKLNMKWNEDWDVGNVEHWSNPPYRAWLDNEINGAGFSEHFKTKWDAGCASTSTTGSDGAPCIWGAFEILMDQATENGSHVWWTKLSPAGFGN